MKCTKQVKIDVSTIDNDVEVILDVSDMLTSLKEKREEISMILLQNIMSKTQPTE